MGRDEHGRQVQEFVSGRLAMDAEPMTLPELRRVGSIVRAIHDASAGFVPDARAVWDSPIPAPGADLVCHNDLAPWNLIVGARWVFIDWDASAPSTRLWDLAYAAQAFTLNQVSQQPEEAAAGLAAFVAGYGASRAIRLKLPSVMGDRTAAMLELLSSSAAAGREPWGSMYVAGHGDHWAAATQYVRSNVEVWHRALQATEDS
jgi:hypothetical protein